MHTIKEAAAASKISVQTIYSQIRRGQIRTIKLGRSLFLTKEQYARLCRKRGPARFKSRPRSKPALRESRAQQTLLTSSQVARHIGITPDYVTQLVRNCRLQSSKIIERGKGKQYLFTRKEADRLKSYKDEGLPFPKIEMSAKKIIGKEYQAPLPPPLIKVSPELESQGWEWHTEKMRPTGEVTPERKRKFEMFEYIRQIGWMKVKKISPSQSKNNKTVQKLTPDEYLIVKKYNNLADNLFCMLERDNILRPAEKFMDINDIRKKIAELPKDIKGKVVKLVEDAYGGNLGEKDLPDEEEYVSDANDNKEGFRNIDDEEVGSLFLTDEEEHASYTSDRETKEIDMTITRAPVRYIGE